MPPLSDVLRSGAAITGQCVICLVCCAAEIFLQCSRPSTASPDGPLHPNLGTFAADQPLSQDIPLQFQYIERDDHESNKYSCGLLVANQSTSTYFGHSLQIDIPTNMFLRNLKRFGTSL
jgi:hypothetical protein